MHEWQEQGVVDRLATPRAEAIAQFAALLRELRASVGSPSFRTMSGRSHAISHTTLHEAAQGNRLPSWATTAEFVKACDADPAGYRERWERANQAIRSGGASPDASGLDESHDEDVAADGGEDLPSIRVRAPRRWSRQIVAGTAIAGLLVAGSVVAGIVVSRGARANGGPGFPAGSSSAAPPLTGADCPVEQPNPVPASPPDPGDSGVFIGDITLPDCTHVARGSTVTKVWRFKNVGIVPWHGYALHRIDLPQQRDQCQTITDVPIKDTAPGQIVDIRVMVTAPNNPGFCFVRFKIEDASGRLAFPGRRPVNFQLIVD